ncbi:MAG: DUF952 domain-containing protein [Bacteroidetes bacterium]|nr:DUF952 domain-containing protein [Bacteroidota bacterium]
MIYHIATPEDWNRSAGNGDYFPSGYPAEGFIHASTLAQVPGVVSRYYKSQKGLLLLEIDESKLTAPVRYEVSTAHERYPHIYGTINRNAVIKVTALESFMNPNQK